MGSLTASPAASVSPPAVALRLLSDERLARWAAKGSEAAFSVIFERHHEQISAEELAVTGRRGRAQPAAGTADV